jgi:TPR repeat protein
MLVVKKSAVIVMLLSITACTTNENVKNQSETMRICDPSGCIDRPKDYAPDSVSSPAEEQANAKLVALEQIASQDPRAAYDLALRFFRGDGVRQDSYLSLKWMRDAAERGDLKAQKALGRLYLTGLGEMGADYGEAQKWLSITVSRGDKEAETLLKEATEARKSELKEYQYYNRWRSVFYNSWYRGYSYNWYWNVGRWYLYLYLY